MLKISTNRTVQLLKSELEIQLNELEEQWHFLSLERIFIENKIYRDIEEETTKEGVINAVDEGLKPHIKHLKRAITQDDILRLLDIRIMRISKFDSNKAQQKIEALEADIEQVKHHLAHLIEFAITYFTKLKEKYGKGRERKTELRSFDNIEATKVALRNTKLYVNRAEGFVGTSLKKDEYVADCSDIDDVIVILRNGGMMVCKVDDKKFIGKDIIHVSVFDKTDKRTIYNMIYQDGKSGPSYIKRFNVSSITRDRLYDLTNGTKGSQILYLSHNPNGEAEVISVLLRQIGSIKKLKWDIDFSDLAIKGRGSKGNLVTKYSIKKIELKSEGVSTLKPRRIWFDETVQRLNVEERGELLGEFRGEDRLLIITQKGLVKTIKPELTTHFDTDMIVLEKWVPEKPISAIYYDGEKERYFIKRFMIDNPNKEEIFISDHPKSQLEIVSTDYRPMVEVVFSKRSLDNIEVNLEDFIAVKGIKALGNQLTTDKIKVINMLEPLPYDTHVVDEVEVNEEEVIDADDNNDEDSNTDKGKGQTKLF
jgi:topoisomerase-4 subunit A